METRRLAELVASAEKPTTPVLALPPLLFLDEIEHLFAPKDLDAALAALQPAIDHPLVLAYLQWKRAQIAANTGDVDNEAEILRQLGFLTQWHLVGPFPNEGMSGYDTPFAPELSIDTAATVSGGRFDDLQWLPYRSVGRVAYLRLSSVIAPTTDAVTYLATVVESPRKQNAVLRLSVDGAYKAWLNQDLVALQQNDYGGTIDRDAFPIALQAGPNLLLIKIANTSGYAGAYVRLTTPEHRPLPLPHGNILPATDTAARHLPSQSLPSLVDELLAYVESPPPNAEPKPLDLAWIAYGLHRLSSADPSKPGDNLMRSILEHHPQPTTAILLLAVQVLEESWRHRSLIDTALGHTPQDPWLLATKAEQLLLGSTLDQTGERHTIIQNLVQHEPDAVLPRLLQSDEAAQEGLLHTAIQSARDLFDRHPHSPAAADKLYSLALRANDIELQDRALDSLVALQADRGEHREDLATRRAQRGDLEGALAMVDDGLRVNPDAFALKLFKIRLLDAQGLTDDAAALFRATLSQTPTSATLWQRYGDWLLARELRDEAIEAYRRSLTFASQNETLRQMVHYLDANLDAFESPYLIEDLKPYLVAESNEAYVSILEQKITQLHPNGLTSTFYQVAYQALNEDGVTALRHFPIFYSPLQEVLDIVMVRVTKSDGTVRKVYDRSEQSVADESIRMYYDYRQVLLRLSEISVGDIVEVRFRRSQTQASSYLDRHYSDVWFMQDGTPKSFIRYVVITPPNVTVNFRLPPAFEEWEAANDARFLHTASERENVWIVGRRNVPKMRSERMMPGTSAVADYLIASTFSTWQEVAQWYWNLAKDQWILDKEIRDTVQRLIQDVDDPRERVARIHNFVVKSTRYVALEFGIHGYKPYRTTLTFRRRFGDCKDKASLLKVMLEEAGIPTDIVLVRTKRNGAIDTEPPSLSIFDHAIAYVPSFDLFLDGTAEFSGTGELPYEDQGVTVLIVKDQGNYELRQTPVAPALSSPMAFTYRFDLAQEEVILQGQGRIEGHFAPSYRQRYESSERQRDLLEAEIASDFPGAALDEFSIEATALEAPVHLAFQARLPRLLTRVGDELHLYPLGRRSDLAQRLAPSATRDHALHLPFPFVLPTQATFQLGPHTPIRIPEEVDLSTPFGHFQLRYTQHEGTITVESDFLLERHHISAAEYPEFQAFIRTVDRHLNTPLRFEAK